MARTRQRPHGIECDTPTGGAPGTRPPYCLHRRGMTMVELVVTSTLTLVIVLAVGTLIEGGQRSWLVPSPSEPDTIVRADAVEFRSWDAELDQTDSHDVMNTEKAATAYDLFYVEAGQLKVDHGVYPPGAVPSGSGGRNTAGVTTRVLASHVIVDPNVGPFSHTTNAGVGQGCVRLSLTLKDPATDKTTRVLAAALMRNIWPR
jgi:hypothetical protein